MSKKNKTEKQLSFIDFLKIYVIGIFSYFLYLIYFSVVFIQKPKELKRTLKSEDSIIFAFFHQDIFSIFNLLQFSNFSFMISKSKDGRIFAVLLRLLFYKIIGGSRNKDGKKAMYKIINLFNKKKAKAILIAVDGSRGPIYRVKPGAIKIALETGATIVPIGFKYSRFFMLKKSWDKTIIPKPFSRAKVCLGHKIKVLKTDNFEEKLQELELELRALKGKEFINNT